MDGELVGVIGDTWELETESIPVSWHSVKGLNKKSIPEIIHALREDVVTLNASNISTTSSYFYGKLIARAARLALISEEVSYPKIIFDPAWGKQYKRQAYSIVEDYTNLELKEKNQHYTRLTEFPFGRNQESTSEAIIAYYSAALMGSAYGDADLVFIGSTLTAFEIQSAQTWWHVKGDNKIYAPSFVKKNKVVGILWSRKRDSILWFAPSERKDIRLGIQVLPLLPITEVVFSDVAFVKELVKWALTSVPKNRTEEGWK
ncbi:hypothetical protein K7X08_018862 [Anisodus acutangulus]|uniref:glucan endo-1,3-beta-D-glucosidase n=1 Tax=Anisodus acutangulus TaxID=402998 RepID=A0A9Q1LXR6_9SOLA|nr:hypothetical protein K7X08_018862 [Anisodus acutangulus]